MPRPLVFLFALAAPFLFGAAVFAVYGVDPAAAFAAMAAGAFGSWPRFLEVLTRAAPLTLTGLSVIVPARMNLWNIGAEGQLVCGAIAATATALFAVPGLPGPFAVCAGLAAGALGGALWALPCGVLRARFGVSEILTTLMLGYAAVILMEHLFYGPWRDPAGMGFPGTAMVVEAYRLPRLPGSRLHLGFGLGLVLSLAAWLATARTKWGFALDVLGASPRAARYAGMNAAAATVSVLALAGALAGLAGAAEVMGIHYRLQRGLAAGYGYDGVIVACLAGLRPALAVPAAVCLAGVIVGGEYLQTKMHLSASISLVLEGAILLSFLAWRAAQARAAKDIPTQQAENT